MVSRHVHRHIYRYLDASLRANGLTRSREDDAASWSLELYLTPSGVTFWVAISTLCSLVITGVVVAALKVKERREDKNEAKERAHLFAFNAL